MTRSRNGTEQQQQPRVVIRKIREVKCVPERFDSRTILRHNKMNDRVMLHDRNVASSLSLNWRVLERSGTTRTNLIASEKKGNSEMLNRLIFCFASHCLTLSRLNSQSKQLNHFSVMNSVGRAELLACSLPLLQFEFRNKFLRIKIDDHEKKRSKEEKKLFQLIKFFIE